MRLPFVEAIEQGRIVTGEMGSRHGDPYGAFIFPPALTVIAASADANNRWWDHVSVSTPTRTPNWEEMEYIRGLFWADDEWVIQFSPARSQHINVHPHCLHMWKPARKAIPKPPEWQV